MLLTNQSLYCSCSYACMHAQQSVIERRPQSGSLTRSWICIRALRMTFCSTLEFGYVVLGLFFHSKFGFDLTSTPTIADSSRHRSSISLISAYWNHVEHSFRGARPLWTLSRLPSPCDYFEQRRNINNKTKGFQHRIDSQFTASSCLISPHLATCAVEVGPGAASFLAKESTATVIIARLMTRIAGH